MRIPEAESLTNALKNKQKDALVIGAGIAGLQAALDCADQGKNVVVVERSPSIGGANDRTQ